MPGAAVAAAGRVRYTVTLHAEPHLARRNLLMSTPNRRSYVVAILLSFFLGGLGVDRFYMGYIGLGIAKLLTLGGCGIWSLIDFILIVVGKLKDADGQELER
jgi:TM2 domain-containing membrane protein YozV